MSETRTRPVNEFKKYMGLGKTVIALKANSSDSLLCDLIAESQMSCQITLYGFTYVIVLCVQTFIIRYIRLS